MNLEIFVSQGKPDTTTKKNSLNRWYNFLWLIFYSFGILRDCKQAMGFLIKQINCTIIVSYFSLVSKCWVYLGLYCGFVSAINSGIFHTDSVLLDYFIVKFNNQER